MKYVVLGLSERYAVPAPCNVALKSFPLKRKADVGLETRTPSWKTERFVPAYAHVGAPVPLLWSTCPADPTLVIPPKTPFAEKYGIAPCSPPDKFAPVPPYCALIVDPFQLPLVMVPTPVIVE